MSNYIMLVDDSSLVRKTLKNILLSTKHSNVIEAENGQAAIDMYSKYKPLLVFMDVLMPGMSGIDALKQILMQDPNANIVMCSSLGQDSIVSEAMQSGAKSYIMKPFTTDKILDVLKMILGE